MCALARLHVWECAVRGARPRAQTKSVHLHEPQTSLRLAGRPETIMLRGLPCHRPHYRFHRPQPHPQRTPCFARPSYAHRRCRGRRRRRPRVALQRYAGVSSLDRPAWPVWLPVCMSACRSRLRSVEFRCRKRSMRSVTSRASSRTPSRLFATARLRSLHLPRFEADDARLLHSCGRLARCVVYAGWHTADRRALQPEPSRAGAHDDRAAADTWRANVGVGVGICRG